MSKFLNNISLEAGNDIQFKTTAGSNAGKIEQVGDNLVLSNVIGDVLLGDGASDVYIGDGTNNVDIVFEQSGSIRGDGSAITLTLGGANTTLNLENPNVNGNLSLGTTSINNKLTFTTANGYILFDHEPSGDTGPYEGATSVPLLKIDRSGSEKTILERISQEGGILLGADDSVIIAAGDTRSTLRSNLNESEENVILASEGGFHAYGFPSNDTTWSNRNEFRFYTSSSTASNNGLYIGDGTSTQFIDLSRNLKNIGTISSGAITSSSSVTATSFVKSGGSSSQFLKANGSVDSTAYAPLASPALTGNPTAPTQAANNNSTRIATTAYVQTELADLIGGAPTALDTLNELAAAINDDSAFSSTVTTALGNRLRIDIGNQGLTSTQQGYGRTNLGLGTAATFASTAFATAAQGTSAETAYGWGNHASAGYITGNQTITLSGDATGSGTTSISVSLAANAVGASELNVSGNGTATQFLRSDGDGTFTWATPPDNNTTYSAGNGIGLSGTTFSVAAGGGLSQDASGLSHSDTSTQASVNNSNGTVIQDIFLDTYGHVSGIGSYNLDSRYYTESEVNTYFKRGYSNQAVEASSLTSGAWYTIAQNTGDRAVARFGLRDGNSGDHQSVVFYAAHHYGTDQSSTITVLHNSFYSGSPFRYIRIKDYGTYDGAVLQVYLDGDYGGGSVSAYLLGDNFQNAGWDLVDWLADATAPSLVSNYSSFTMSSQIDLDQIAQGGIATTGPIYGDGDTSQYRMFNDNYHPNADKLTTARNIALTGAVTGNTNFDGSGNISIATTATADPTLTLAGDASGSATFTNLGNATLTVTVADDSHNHIISNVDGLQTALDAKQAAGTYNTIIGTDTDISYSGATVLSAMTMTDGVIQSHSSRTLTLADLGYTGATNANNYSLPLAASGTRGGVQIGYAENGKNYPVELSSEKMFVNVPWTDNNTTYTAGRGLDLSGTEFQLETDLRDSVSLIGLDSNDYVQWSNNSYFRSVVNGTERFRVNTAGIDVTGTATANAFRSDTSSTDYSIITRNTAATNYVMYVQANQSGSTQSIASFRYGSAVANQGSEVLAIRRDSSYFSNTKLGIGTTNPSTALHVEGTVTHKVYTASTLPSASPEGQRSFISDSAYGLATAIGSVVSGGGSNTIPVYSDGFSWRAG